MLTGYQIYDSSDSLQQTKSISYNSYGFPTTGVGSSGYSFTDGGRLTGYTVNSETVQCEYNSEGIRTKKTLTGADSAYTLTTDYILDGAAIVGEKRELTGIMSYSWTLYYMYDDNGEVIGFTYKAGNNPAEEYYYGKNLQGDVVAIYDRFGVKQVGYTYDAWGNIASATGALASTVGTVNPFRYRSYYYDTDSGMYYLNARYYNPALCRFISPDSILGANGDLHSYNLYAYCSNNPVMFADPSGYVYVLYDPLNDFDRGKGGILPANPKKTEGYIYRKSILDELPVRDVTSEVNNALEPYLIGAENIASIADDYSFIELYLYSEFVYLVMPKSDWDLKDESSWKKTIGTPYPGEGASIIYRGTIMSLDKLGNFTYGYLGAAYGIDYKTLIGGSMLAAAFTGALQRQGGYQDEIIDQKYIALGYIMYIFERL